MATVSQWTPFGVALNLTATAGTVTRKSATQYTVVINASWDTYWDDAKTNYGMSATSGGVTKTISSFGTSRSSGSASFTGTYSISGYGSATKTITVTFKNYEEDWQGNVTESATKAVSFNVTVPALASYTVKYNANGGSGAPSNQTKYKGVALTLSSTKPTRTGYTFLGWSTSSTATSATYSAGGTLPASVNAATTLYAVWKANTLTIKYHVNGGTLDSDTYHTSSSLVYKTASSTAVTTTGTYNKVISSSGLYNASTFGLYRTGYNFKGWKVGSSGTTVFSQDDATLVPTDLTSNIKTSSCTITMYAVWELKTYTLAYNANGGKGTMSSETVKWNESFSPANCTFTREGYKFVGWNVYRNSDSTWYVVGQGWLTEGEITTNGYSKKIYTSSEEYTMNLSWIRGSESTTKFTFYAIWEISGVVYIDNGTEFEPYLAYIDNGTNWELYFMYVDNGISWDIVS